MVAVQSKTILRNTIQRDIDNLPALLAAKGYKESQEYQVNYWVYILGGLLTNARKACLLHI